MSEEPFFRADQITAADGKLEIIDFQAEPYADQRRIKVTFRLSFFQEPPNAAISLFDHQGVVITTVDLVNITDPENEITLHIPRSVNSNGEFELELTLFKLEEREAQPDEKGEVKLATHKLSSRRIPFSQL
jgi:hypothetical protein